MIAEATTSREQRRQQQRRRSAARQQTNAALREVVAQGDRLPTEAPTPEYVEQQHSAAEQSLEAFWERLKERQREAMDAWFATPTDSAPAADPALVPPVVVGQPGRYVVPNAIAGKAPVVRKPGPTFADVLRTYDPEYRRRYGALLTVQQDKVLREMLACYTSLLGMHEWTCADCRTVVELPNGCNNRHCCTCGYATRTRWAEDVCARILPVEYCHLILTVPAPITQLAMINQRVLYDLVLKEGASAVLACGRKLFDIELALLSLLHSWGQLLLNHVHTHSLVPLGGLRCGALEWIDLSQEQLDQLLERVRYEFPRRLCRALRKAYAAGRLQFDGDAELAHLQSPAEFERWLKPLEDMAWIIRCGDSWDRTKMDHGPEATLKIIQYLANYVGRVALSDSRILDIQGDRVLFKYKDYRDNNQQKADWIEGVELIRRFMQHLLPHRFRHIRRYGWMGPVPDQQKVDFIRQYHGLGASDEEAQQQSADAPLDEQEHTQTCRFCTGQMKHTDSTRRPRVSEVMAMPLVRFRRAQAGARVTLGARLPQIEAQRSGDESAPAMRARYQEIRKQLLALTVTGHL